MSTCYSPYFDEPAYPEDSGISSLLRPAAGGEESDNA